VTFAPFAFPARPPSEVEWEELLVRLEITPRALGLAVEDAGGDSAVVREVLRDVIGNEIWWTELLQRLRDGRPVHMNRAIPLFPGPEPSAGELVEGFAQLRERNFAQVQRRGLVVWDWESPIEGREDTLTAYQVLQSMAHADGEMLAAVRAAGRG
jgi:hypothetical protein